MVCWLACECESPNSDFLLSTPEDEDGGTIVKLRNSATSTTSELNSWSRILQPRHHAPPAGHGTEQAVCHCPWRTLTSPWTEENAELRKRSTYGTGLTRLACTQHIHMLCSYRLQYMFFWERSLLVSCVVSWMVASLETSRLGTEHRTSRFTILQLQVN